MRRRQWLALWAWPAAHAASAPAAATERAPQPAAARAPAGRAASPAPAPAAPLLDRLLRITGLALAPGQLRGVGDAVGSIWVADVQGRQPPLRWTTGSNFRSPVFTADGLGLYALLDEQLFRLDGPGSRPTPLQRLPGVHKLVGLLDGELLLLRDEVRQPLAALPLAPAAAVPRILPIAADSDEAGRWLGRIRGEARGTEGFVIGPQRQEREGLAGRVEWSDIVLQPRDGSLPRNLSRSGGLDCAQPALDARAERVAYVVVDG